MRPLVHSLLGLAMLWVGLPSTASAQAASTGESTPEPAAEIVAPPPPVMASLLVAVNAEQPGMRDIGAHRCGDPHSFSRQIIDERRIAAELRRAFSPQHTLSKGRFRGFHGNRCRCGSRETSAFPKNLKSYDFGSSRSLAIRVPFSRARAAFTGPCHAGARAARKSAAATNAS